MKRIMMAVLLFLGSMFLCAGRGDAAEPPVVLAGYQAWFGLSSHLSIYDSQNTAVIDKQIQKAKAMGIAGFVVDWYGPAQTGLNNTENRGFIDNATAVLISRAEAQNFKIALMYDEGAIKDSGIANTDDYQNQVQTDLNYAKKYFSSSAYLNINDHPALFIFPYDDVNQYVTWNVVRTGLETQVTLIDKNPNPDTPDYDALFDGFYAWVQSTNSDNWSSDGKDWGEGYLNWFYSTMKGGSYVNKTMVGGVWPGFDDLLASWSENRFISRQNGRVYRKTMALAQQKNAPFILIETWNDFEEGTDIEFGVKMTVNMEDNDPSYPALLVRSSPFKVEWNSSRGLLPLQVYKDGNVIYENQHAYPGISIKLDSKARYELKLWLPDGKTLSKWIMIRNQDFYTPALPFLIPLQLHHK